MNILHLSHSRNTDGGISIVLKELIKDDKKFKSSWITNDSYPSFLRDINLLKAINKRNFDILHIHGLWRSPNRLTSFFLRNQKPYIITPHGMLDNWALKNSYFKKKLALFLWEKRALKNAVCMQALCENEISSIKKIVPNMPVALIPNGINLPNLKIKNDQNLIWRNDIKNSKKILLFLGRFHKKKGISELLTAWRIVREKNKDINWRLVFVGSGDDQYIKKRIKDERIPFCEIYNSVSGDLKDSTFKNSSAFILPSYSEGLPMAVLEAMSYKLPCLISDACNFAGKGINDAFIKSDPEIGELTLALNNLFNNSQNELHMMGEIGYKYVSKNYNWEIINEKFFKLYSWLINGDSKPDFIV